jgi:acetoacetyl-CoA synthetase
MAVSGTKSPGEKKGQVLWTPSRERVEASRLFRFARAAETRSGRAFPDYAALHRWSIEDLSGFWKAVWDFCEVHAEGEIESVLADPRMPGARWFGGARLNFAENLLRHAEALASRPAIVFEAEDEGLRRSLTFAELRLQAARCAAALRSLGVRAGDRVAALTPNLPEAIVAMLGCASIGAIWSSCSPDFGPQGVFDRFGQIEPAVLFAADGAIYGGKRFGLGERLRDVLDRIPSIRHAVIYEHCGPKVEGLRGQISWEDFLAAGDAEGPAFERFPFAQPLYILYTSGTTGVPKCIVHGAGGTLLKHLEEHVLQGDLRPGDALFYFTTCGWMMWNWLASGLASGAAIVLYDGNPLHPDPGRLFRLADRAGVTHFGASPRFLAALEKSGCEPRREHSLASLRTIYSTGAPLHAGQFEWVYRAIKKDVQLASISGGTDLIGCFVLGSPFHPVHAGEIQCLALGMKVESLGEDGRPRRGEKGELVCSAPFPSMPLGFWNDPDGSRYRKAYFERYPGRWHHGDFIEITPRGSAIIYGRSDATLNPGGVRIGTAEIYRIVERLPEIADALAVGHAEDGDERILLFVVLKPGAALDGALEGRIRAAIREHASPRHVPREIHACPELPRTVSGKSVELAVGRILRGEEALNQDALANPQSLEFFRNFAAQRRR